MLCWVQNVPQIENHNKFEKHKGKLVLLKYTIILQSKVDHLQT